MADNKEQLDDNLIKALKNVLSESEFDEFMKGQKPDEKKEKEDEDDEESEEEVIEKAFKKAKEEYASIKKAYKDKKKESGLFEMKKGLKAKKEEIKKAFPNKPLDEDDEEDEDEEIPKGKEKKEVEKSIQPDLVKAFSDALDLKLKDITKANSDLIGSFNELKNENSELKKAIDIMGSQRTGFKSVSKGSFIEKANQNGFESEDGKKVLSVSQHKTMVENVLGDALEKAENPTIKKAIGDCLVGYNAGGAQISQEIASYLYANHNTKLVQ